jgi:hypothetical protein
LSRPSIQETLDHYRGFDLLRVFDVLYPASRERGSGSENELYNGSAKLRPLKAKFSTRVMEF